MEVDLGRRLVFPDIVKTTLRPDIVLWSKTWKKLIVIELIVLWETRFEEKESKVHRACGPLQTAMVAYLAVPR